jgi:hypothetical protein
MDDSDIPFLDALGRDFHRVAIDQMRGGGRRQAWRRWSWRAAPVALLICAGTAAAGVLLLHRTPTELVAGGLSCVGGTNTATQVEIFDVEPRGLTPLQACGRALKMPASRLIPCVDNRHGTVVFEASGAADQCEAMKMSPLPAGYATATRRIARLQRALNAVYDAHRCLTPAQLAADSRQVLRRLGFTGWRTRLESYRPADVNGGCAQFEEGPRGTSNAAWTLARGHVVVIMTGPPRPIAGLPRPTSAKAPRSDRSHLPDNRRR